MPTPAQQLITQTFDQAYDEAQFTYFCRELLNQLDTSRATGYRSGNMIPQAFQGHISRYHRLGVYTDPDGNRLDVLAIQLSKATALDRARTMQRNFISHYISLLSHSQPVDGVLAAYYHKDVANWRFRLSSLNIDMGKRG